MKRGPAKQWHDGEFYLNRPGAGRYYIDEFVNEVNYRRNGMKYPMAGKCWGMASKAGGFASDLPAKGPKPKSSRERRAQKKAGR